MEGVFAKNFSGAGEDSVVGACVRLGAMARCHESNTGRLPTTVKELADHWYDMSDRLVVLDPPEERQTVAEVDAPNHYLKCIWLRDIEKRPDADALLVEAMLMDAPRA